MNCYFTIILYVVEESKKMMTFCIVAIFRETFRMEWLRKDVFIFNLTGVYKGFLCLWHKCLPFYFTVMAYSPPYVSVQVMSWWYNFGI